jgi:hypothetical protein
MDYLTRKRRELTAAMRKQRELEKRFADIAWEDEVLGPALADLERRITAGEKVEIKMLEAAPDVRS